MSELYPQRTPGSFTKDYLGQIFVIEQLLGRMITIAPVEVISVTGAGSLTSCPYVTVQPLLNQMTGNGQGFPHGPIHNVPCWRMQSGSTAVVLDPSAGDVGLLLACFRDATPLVAADQGAPGSLQGAAATFNPGSAAQYDWGSGFYLGGVLNGEVSTYIQLTASLCKVVAPSLNLNGVSIDSSGNISTAGNITTTGGNVTAGTIDLKNHVHTGVTTGSGSTGPPTG